MKLKKILKDIWINYWFPLVAGLVGIILFSIIYKEFDFWYYLGISLLSGGGVACIVYLIINYLEK